MAGLKSFRSPITARLKAWGFASLNDVGDIAQDEADTFNLEPGRWEWNGTQWIAVPQATLDAELLAEQRQTAQDALSSPDGQQKLLRAVAAVLLDQVNTLRSVIARPLLSLNRSGTTATATTFVAHGLTSGETVFVTGAAVAAYNGSKTVTVTSPTTFTFTVSGNPATPATGSISFVLGTVASLEPITFDQVVAAVTAKIQAGVVDQAARAK